MEEETLTCRDCNKAMPVNGKRKKRQKRCKDCSRKRDRLVTRSKPGRYLSVKLRAQKRKHGRIPDDEKDLYTKEVAQSIYELFEGKSYLSGKSELDELCIATKVKKPRTRDDLVLLTTKEATTLARKKTDEERLAFLEANKMKIV